jgi:hypothetical protein
MPSHDRPFIRREFAIGRTKQSCIAWTRAEHPMVLRLHSLPPAVQNTQTLLFPRLILNIPKRSLSNGEIVTGALERHSRRLQTASGTA